MLHFSFYSKPFLRGWLGIVLFFMLNLSPVQAAPLPSAIRVEAKDLKKTETGEGLAKPLPGQPVMINHPLNMAMALGMDNGVAIAVGSHVGVTKKIIKSFEEMPTFDLEAGVNRELKQLLATKQGQQGILQLQQSKQTLILRPYVYLFGNPKATLESRLVMILQNDEGALLQEKVFASKSESYPITGTIAWSADEGKLLKETATRAFPTLLNQLFEELASLSKSHSSVTGEGAAEHN